MQLDDRSDMADPLVPAAEMKHRFRGTTDNYWSQLRHKGTGPNYVKVVRKVYYRESDIEAWIEANLHSRTDRPYSASGRQ
jgi:predicted DNA-binding transcriptional regulator AlpA